MRNPGKDQQSRATTIEDKQARRRRLSMSRFVRIVAATFALTGLPSFALAQGNADNGEDVFKKCRACHEVGPDAKNKLGPTLNNIIGRKAGTVEGFNYSDANKEAGSKGLVWTEEVLFKYLETPMKLMPGTKMAFGS
jgi:cytochrome c